MGNPTLKGWEKINGVWLFPSPNLDDVIAECKRQRQAGRRTCTYSNYRTSKGLYHAWMNGKYNSRPV